jgi:3-deoxy-manno-octulosonate cytidylyltransferase (CMP-KDO synthetase)
MLRILEKGYRIRCVKTGRDTIEIDTPEDVARLEAWLREHGDDVK